MFLIEPSGELHNLVSGPPHRKRAKCPVCASQVVYFSRWRSLREQLMRGQGMRPYRCHLCHNRFLDRANLRCYGTPGGNVMLLPPKTKIEMPRWKM